MKAKQKVPAPKKLNSNYFKFIEIAPQELNQQQKIDMLNLKNTMIAITQLEHIDQREDQHKRHDYNSERILDTLARVLNIDTCAAIAHSESANKFIMSFNSTLDYNHQLFLNEILSAINTTLQDSNIYHIVHSDRNLLQQIKAFEQNVLTVPGENIQKCVVSFKKFKEYYSTHQLNNEKYAEFIVDMQSHGIIGEALDKFIRPVQDAKKLLAAFNEQNVGKIIVDLLENPQELHAEINLLEYKITKKLAVDEYTGISKLCCALCEFVLEEGHVAHRGKHGVLFENGWNLTPNLLNKIPGIINKINDNSSAIINKILNMEMAILTKKDSGYVDTLLKYVENKTLPNIDVNVIERVKQIVKTSAISNPPNQRNKNKMDHDLSDDEGEPLNSTFKLFKDQIEEVEFNQYVKEHIALANDCLLSLFYQDITSNLSGANETTHADFT
ncbi:nucleic acid/nucleotide deaminase domain-containing protein [Candidatus Trichorickettsia mobilis]|uniref:nucleic acid/nucleotide deaminase domain-containing protein n=1 Tax=Candidatus Trichorickettsia mobilis TaxID=1346319 RepID=UPI00292CC163|nr:nucleic acid/nucleotide deaminase domain-containing protein [Candidatus Trichorickettsia mobilis]